MEIRYFIKSMLKLFALLEWFIVIFLFYVEMGTFIYRK